MKKALYFSIAAFVVSLGTLYFVLNKLDQKSFGSAITISTISTSTLKGLNLSTGCVTYNGGSCIGNTLNGYEQIAAATAGPTSNNSSGQISVSCTGTKKVLGCMGSSTRPAAFPYLQSLETNTTYTNCTATFRCDGSGCSANTISAIANCAN